MERFTQVLPEYRKAPEVTRERLYIQTMEKVMKNTPKLMMDSANGNNLTVLPVDKLLQNKAENQPLTQPKVVIPSAPTAVQPQVIQPQNQDVSASEPVRKGRF